MSNLSLNLKGKRKTPRAPLTAGQKFGKLTSISFSHIGPNKQAFWLFKCDCGNDHIMRSCGFGKTKSCGKCIYQDFGNMFGSNHPLYFLYHGMIQRCEYPSHKGFSDYGGRGIKISPEWRSSFITFLKDMGPRPKGYTVERINNSIGYCKENCRWASRKEQCNNKRNNRLINYKGKTLTLQQWSERLGLPYDRLRHRLKRGLPAEKILSPQLLINKLKCN